MSSRCEDSLHGPSWSLGPIPRSDLHSPVRTAPSARCEDNLRSRSGSGLRSRNTRCGDALEAMRGNRESSSRLVSALRQASWNIRGTNARHSGDHSIQASCDTRYRLHGSPFDREPRAECAIRCLEEDARMEVSSVQTKSQSTLESHSTEQSVDSLLTSPRQPSWLEACPLRHRRLRHRVLRCAYSPRLMPQLLPLPSTRPSTIHASASRDQETPVLGVRSCADGTRIPRWSTSVRRSLVWLV